MILEQKLIQQNGGQSMRLQCRQAHSDRDFNHFQYSRITSLKLFLPLTLWPSSSPEPATAPTLRRASLQPRRIWGGAQTQ